MSHTERKRLSGVRGLIARRMLQSLQQSAQLTFHATVDASSLLSRRESSRPGGATVSVEDMVAHAAAGVLGRYAGLNGTIVEDEVETGGPVHLGFAISAGQQLLVGVVRDAERLSLPALAAARRDLVTRARENTLRTEQMRGGTFTVSNLGRGRTGHFTPILNPGQIGLLGLGALAPGPWVLADGTLGVRPLLHLSLTVDHRVVDGAPANAFLTALCETLERERG